MTVFDAVMKAPSEIRKKVLEFCGFKEYNIFR